MRGAFLWGPRKFLICGESGGIGRLNDDGGISQCDPIAEHDLYTLHYTPLAYFATSTLQKELLVIFDQQKSGFYTYLCSVNKKNAKICAHFLDFLV